MAPKSKVEEQMLVCRKAMDKLSSMNVPVVMSINYGGKIQSFGSKYAQEYLSSNDELKTALNKDALALCAGDSVRGEPVTNGPKKADIKQLPAPIHLLNREEAVEALRDLIVYDHNKCVEGTKKKKERYIKYGQESWEPSFWPNHIWSWDKMKNFSEIRVENLRNAGLRSKYNTLVDFWKHVLQLGFAHLKLDPSEYIKDSFDEHQAKMRRRAKHIKSPPVITNVAPSSNTTAPELENPDDEGLAHSEEEFSENFAPHEVELEGEQYQYRPISDSSGSNSVQNYEPPAPSANASEEPSSLESLFFAANDEVPIPRTALSRVWPNCRVKRNQRGASSISRSVAQYVGLDEEEYWRIKMYIHAKIVEDFSELIQFFNFPLHLMTEDDPREFINEAELKKYLNSPHSMSLYNIPEVELLALAGLTGGQIHVLHKNLTSDDGIDFNEGWEWNSYSPIAPQKINKKGYLYTGSPVYMITDDGIHFYCLSGLNSTLSTTATADTQNHDNVDDEAIINEAQEELDTERFAMVPIEKFAKEVEQEQANPVVQEQDTNGPKELEVRRSTRRSKKTEKYSSYQQGKRKATREKDTGGASKKPTASNRNEIDLSEIDENYLDEEHLRLLNAAKEVDQMILNREQEVKKLREMGHEIRSALSVENVRALVADNLEYLKGIESGKVKSWRRDYYRSGKDEQQLLFLVISEPFTVEQQEVVHQELRKHFLKNLMTISRFIDLVLVPETLIRIYQTFFDISRKDAEKNLKQQGVYKWSSSSSSNDSFL